MILVYSMLRFDIKLVGYYRANHESRAGEPKGEWIME